MTLTEELLARANSYDRSGPGAEHTADLLRRAALRIDRLNSTASPLDLYSDKLGVKLADDLVRIADACRREDGTDIPLGDTLRDAAHLIAAQRAALAEIQDFASAAEDDDPMSHVLGVATLGLNGELYRPWDGAVSKWKASIK